MCLFPSIGCANTSLRSIMFLKGAVKGDAKALPLFFVVGLDASVTQIIPVAHDPIRDGLYRGTIRERHD